MEKSLFLQILRHKKNMKHTSGQLYYLLLLNFYKGL